MNTTQPASPDPVSAHILEGIADGVIYADRDGIIRVWNTGAAEVFGFTAQEALGRDLNIIVPEQLREAHWNGFDAAIARGATVGGRKARLTRGLHKDPSRKVYVEMTFAVVLGDDGTATGAVAIARDITEKRLQEVADCKRRAEEARATG